MLDGMSPEMFNEWCVKDKLEPIGEEATRYILALIGVTIARSFGGATSVTVENFMPWLEQTCKQQTSEQMAAIMSMIPGATHHGSAR